MYTEKLQDIGHKSMLVVCLHLVVLLCVSNCVVCSILPFMKYFHFFHFYNLLAPGVVPDYVEKIKNLKEMGLDEVELAV